MCVRWAGFSLCCALALLAQAEPTQLKSIGVSVGSIDNPFYKAMVRGINATATGLNPSVRINTVSAEFSLQRQAGQIADFISQHVDLIVLVAADPVAVGPYVHKAQQAGIVVIAADVDAAGANGSVSSDNVQAGTIACRYLADAIHGRGKFIIQDGPHVSSVYDRIAGCHAALRSYPEITLLTDKDSGQGSSWGGAAIMTEHLQRYPHIDAVFAINDRQAIGANAAAARLGRNEMLIASVDGSPDIEKALAEHNPIAGSATQDPYVLGKMAVELGNAIFKGEKPAQTVIKVTPQFITRANLVSYRGWTSGEVTNDVPRAP